MAPSLLAADNELAPLPPLPELSETEKAQAELGKRLFFDPRLSRDDSISCSTCHQPDKAWTDQVRFGKGIDDQLLKRNAPTVLNSAWLTAYFWDGRSATLEEQALQPIVAPDEMGQELDVLEAKLTRIEGYVDRFQSAFGTEPNREAIAKSLATFQRTLVSQDSPFDRYLKGETDALSPLAKQGMKLFVGEAGCIRCHHGPMLSDGQYYRLGIGSDVGREAVTGSPEDRYKFRTPTLRDVSLTGPYMHDGSLATLYDVVEFYYRTAPRQIEGYPVDIEPLSGSTLSDIPALIAFLESLTGKPIEIEPPELP